MNLKNHLLEVTLVTNNTSNLLKHQQNDFCIQELTLYLDTHPEDRTAMRLLQRHLNMRDDLKEAVQRESGPQTIYDNDTRDWRWVKGPWPWEKEVN